jgi:M6 family metalloprotease-like protein
MDYYGEETEIGDQMILDEALTSLAKTMDLSKFDSDGNDVIDAVVLISTLNVDSEAESNLHWAYRYWNIYGDDDGYYFEYDGVTANDYLWAPYQFMHEGYDRNGNPVYSDTSVMNTYTYIHEFGHVLGADDYYDTSYTDHPLEGLDVMDSMNGDHNPYTKFNFGWLTSSRLVVADGSVTLTLEDFSKNGDTIILANNWDEELGAYQEYYVLIYYKGTGLNGGDNGYFSRDGIVVYHVNASLYVDEESGEPCYDVYNNNTDASDEYGTEDNLIEFVKSPDDTFTYATGDDSYRSSANVKDDSGNKIAYTFTVDSLTETTATITFTKNK